MAWSVSTSDGVALDAEELVCVLAAQQVRLIRGWREFSADLWTCASRNERWSVHDEALPGALPEMGLLAAYFNS